jgi:hypothetical protein
MKLSVSTVTAISGPEWILPRLSPGLTPQAAEAYPASPSHPLTRTLQPHPVYSNPALHQTIPRHRYIDREPCRAAPPSDSSALLPPLGRLPLPVAPLSKQPHAPTFITTHPLSPAAEVLLVSSHLRSVCWPIACRQTRLLLPNTCDTSPASLHHPPTTYPLSHGSRQHQTCAR